MISIVHRVHQSRYGHLPYPVLSKYLSFLASCIHIQNRHSIQGPVVKLVDDNLELNLK